MTSVWVKVYLGEDDKDPRILGFFDFTGNIYQLKQKIKEEIPLLLKHCDAAQLDVYERGTAVADADKENKKCQLDASPPTDTTAKSPLIVIAPKPIDTVSERAVCLNKSSSSKLSVAKIFLFIVLMLIQRLHSNIIIHSRKITRRGRRRSIT